jgi:hypothetical protein
MGSSANPEKGLIEDYLMENLDFWEDVQAIQSAGQDTIGSMDLNSQGADGLTTRWGTVAWLWGKGMTRDARFDDLVTRTTNWQTGCYGGSWISPFYCAIEYHSNFANPYSAALIQTTWNGAWQTAFATSFNDVGIGGFGGSRTLAFTGGGSAAATFSSMWTDMNMSDNDPIMISSPVFITAMPGTTYSGPPEFKPDDAGNACGGSRWFYIRSPSGLNISGLACTPGGAVIPVATASAGNAWVMRPQANPASGYVAGGAVEDTYITQDRMIMCWARALAARGDLDAPITEVNARTGLTAASFSAKSKWGIDCDHPTIE